MSWKKISVSDIITTQKGFAFKSNMYVDFGVPIVRVSNFTLDSISDEDLKYYPMREKKKYTDFILHEKDILIQTVGSWLYNPASVVGKVVHVPNFLEGALLNQNAVKILPKQDVDKDFLYYRLRCDDFKDHVISEARGAANQASITLETIKSFEFIIPDYEQQCRIARIISKYDSLIENNQKQIKLLEEATQRLYKEWFLDLRFPSYESVKVIDGVPVGWKIASILDNDIFKFVKSSVTPFNGKKRYYATADVTGTTFSTAGEIITFLNRPSRASVQPIVNSVWFARMSNTYKIINCFGETAHLASNSIISSGFAGFSSADEYYGFVYATITSKKFNEDKDRYATGATQVSLTNEGLRKIEILLPTEELIKRYSKIIEPFMQKEEALKKDNMLLQEARDRLLPRLMSGEIEI